MIDLQLLHEVHIVGIGGAGMSAIARVLQGRGLTVHGSDRRESPLLDALRAEGMTIAVGHAPENLGTPDFVLASSAVPDDNVELEAARQRDIHVVRRPDFLSVLTAGYDLIAVAGAHGKTTVTGMLALLLTEAGLDPTYIVGGVLANTGTNARVGNSEYFIIEADEYRSTFLALTPNAAVITNIEFDHPDCFPSARFVRLAFGDFVDNITADGFLVACNDDKVAHAVAASYHANGGDLSLYGVEDGVGLAWQARDAHPNDRGGMSFTAVDESLLSRGEVHLRIPGMYNVLNALAALTVASKLGIEWPVAKAALESFKGTARRFEVLGEADSVTVIDDYAHHPTQIRAVIDAAILTYPDRNIIAAWEPHTYSRIRALQADFMTAFEFADHIVVLPIYAAREAPDPTLTAAGLAEQIAHPSVASAADLEAAVATLAQCAQAGDVVLLMGAGNEYLIGQRLLEALAARAV